MKTGSKLLHRLRRVALSSLLLSLFLSLCSWLSTDALALGPQAKARLKFQLELIIKKHPRYVWGGASSEEAGLDCSGYLFLASRRASLPVRRTTALRMRMGLEGWHGRDITLAEADEMDIVWWTFKSDRPDGHIGALIRRPGSGMPAVTHSGTSRGVVVDDLARGLLDKLSHVRQLTIGD